MDEDEEEVIRFQIALQKVDTTGLPLSEFIKKAGKLADQIHGN